ncbi:uncharacterized protein LOC141724438 [Apium graveolens]|uniref:uncharacterized protein LOC141724438 n=1 Tax=Apium graveolens TaxID=4045 RepID=UPI003D79D655
MDMEAVENSDLVDLTGDYESLARGLIHGRCTLGYSATIPALSTPPPTVAQFQELLRNSAQWNMEGNSAVVGQFVYTGHSRSRGTGTYIPQIEYSTSFRERSSRRRLVNLMRGPSGESRRNRDNNIQTSDTFYPGPSQGDNTQGNDVEERTPDSINLNSEYDFPPLN